MIYIDMATVFADRCAMPAITANPEYVVAKARAITQATPMAQRATQSGMGVPILRIC